MEVSEQQLAEVYEQKDTEELLDLYRAGGLTEQATGVLASILEDRGVNFDEEKIRVDTEESKKAQAEKPLNAQKIISGSTTGLYVISALQILTSLAFQFYLGILFGVLLVILSIAIRTTKSIGASLGVAVLGGIAAITNFIGPMVMGAVFGNLILSLITLWLGVRLMKACKSWAELENTHNKATTADR